jgi:uncharacterized protein YdhG (YjbR/CyaY superfamily)
MAEKFPDVDSYIDSFPAEVQDVLTKIRRTIHEAVPGSTETISYNIPTMLRDGRRYAHFSGWARHVALYPIPESSAGLDEELEPFTAGKGTLKFMLNKPIPYELIGRVAAALAR